MKTYKNTITGRSHPVGPQCWGVKSHTAGKRSTSVTTPAQLQPLNITSVYCFEFFFYFDYSSLFYFVSEFELAWYFWNKILLILHPGPYFCICVSVGKSKINWFYSFCGFAFLFNHLGSRSLSSVPSKTFGLPTELGVRAVVLSLPWGFQSFCFFTCKLGMVVPVDRVILWPAWELPV